MNNWLQNIKGQITELATEVLNDATEEGQVSTTSELQIEKKKSTECERLYLAEKSKSEALEKKLIEMEEQLYSVSIESDAVKEKFMGIVSDRDEMIKRLEREMERLKFHQESQDGTFHNVELDSDLTPREGGELLSSQISQLKEKHENEISAILSVHNSNVKQLKEDYERRIEQLEAWNALNLTEPSTGNYEKLMADFNAIKEENVAKNAELVALNSQMEEKNAQIIQLEENLNKMAKDEEQSQEIQRLTILNNQLVASLKELESSGKDKQEIINRFNDSIIVINGDVFNLRKANQKLMEENANFRTSLAEFENVKQLLSTSEENMVNLQEKMTKMKEEYLNEIEEIKQERDNLRQQIEEMSEECRRNEKLLLTGSEEFKPSSDSESAASNNADWEKMGKDEIEVEGVSSSTTTTSETKDSSDAKYSRSERRQRKVEIMEQSIQTEQSSPEEDIQLIQLKDEVSDLINKIAKLEEQLSIEEVNKGQILLEKEEIFEQLSNKEKELTQLKEEFNLLKEERQNNEEKEKQIEEDKIKLESILQEKEETIEQINQLLKESKEQFYEEFGCLRREYEVKLKENEEKFVEDEMEIKRSEIERIENLEEENKKYIESLSTITNDNLQLKSLLENKHSECQQYYSKLEEFSKNLELALNEIKNKENELEMKNGRILKLESDLSRLKEHLLGIEEMSSKEAIASEERETELRRQLREFKDKFENDESLTSKSLQNYKNELEQLKLNLQFLEKEKIDLTSILNEKESSLAETKNALVNLQIVLKDLADEQKTEKLRYEGEIRILRDELKKEKLQLQEFQNKEETIQLTQTTNLDKLNYLESQLKIKNDLIDELENQLEEFRILQQNKEENSIITNSQQHLTNKKIDDSTLKQLFLSFFMAEKSKQPEIAVVMAKILGYSQEEQAQLQKAINTSSSGSSWFSFGASTQPFSRKEISLTEQFIRFLEQESVDNTKSMLALPPIENASPGRGFLLDESPSAFRTSSSTDLKSILDS